MAPIYTIGSREMLDQPQVQGRRNIPPKQYSITAYKRIYDDKTRGFHVGWRWVNTLTQSEYICVDDTANAAVWNSVGSGSVSEPTFSPLDWYVLNAGTAPNSLSGNWTLGTAFIPVRSVRVTGVRFYWANAGGQTVNCKLWDDTSSAIRTVSVVTAGIGYYTGTFSSAYDVPSNKINYTHYATARDNAGGVYTRTSAANSRPTTDNPIIICAPGIRYPSPAFNYFLAGDNKPTSTSAGERYPVEPVFDLNV
jgi:hypothetical protein